MKEEDNLIQEAEEWLSLDWDSWSGSNHQEVIYHAAKIIASLAGRITELEQRLASKEDALAAALLVVDSGSKRVAELEAALKLVQFHAKSALDRLPARWNEGYQKGLRDAGFEYEKLKEVLDRHKAERADDNAVLTEQIMAAETRTEQLQADARQLAEAVIDTHKGLCDYCTIEANEENEVCHNDFDYPCCQCPACQTARRVLKEGE